MYASQHDENLQAAYRQLKARPRADGQGSLYVFSSPKTGSGTSYICRQMAMIAAAQINDGRHVLVLDLDLQNNAQSTYFFSQASQARYGAPTGPYDATFGAVPFWRVTPSAVNEMGQALTDSYFMSLYMLPSSPLSISHFNWEYFQPGQSVHIQNARPYWQALRAHFAAVFIDTPATDRADILSTICPEADTTVLVSATQDSKTRALSDAMKRIAGMGAACAGVILNDGMTPVQPLGAA